MGYLLGIDIGTSGTKTIVVSEEGAVVGSASAEYPLLTPKPNWAEQNPEDWWKAVVSTIRDSLRKAGISGSDVTGIGLSGQMHGSVFLDDQNRVIRPALLWCDQRTAAECRHITEKIGFSRLLELTYNKALTGFTAPKIVWLRNNESENYKRVKKVLLPKDYIRFRLSGEFATEVSDASGTLLFDVANRKWSDTVLDALEIPREWMPESFESQVVSSYVSEEAAAETGLKAGTPIVGGGGDQAAGAVGNGIVRSGIVSAVTGTSGVVFAHMDKVSLDPEGRLHTFCHAVPGKWHVMGVTLAAGGSMRWYRDTICGEEMSVAKNMGVDPYELITSEAATVEPGCEGLLFLPYLAGERTPYPDPNARGVFFGLSLRHTKAHMARAVMEGVTFSLQDCMTLVKEMGGEVEEVRASGGGARSELWRSIQADVFGSLIVTVNSVEGPAYGAAILAAVGTGVGDTVENTCDRWIRVESKICPDEERSRLYKKLYYVYRDMYPTLKRAFDEMAGIFAG